MKISAGELAALLGATVDGDPDIKIDDFAKIEDGKPNCISFLANPKYEKYIYTTHSGVVIVSKDFTPEKEVKATLILVDDAYAAFAKLLTIYEEQQKKVDYTIDSLAFVHNTAKIAEPCSVAAFSYVSENVEIGKKTIIYPQVFIGKGVKIGEDCLIYPGVKIYQSCQIGDNCIIHAGAIIGSDGFGFAPKSAGDYAKIPQIGNVILENGVEIGANTTIDRATMGSTIIKEGVKLDNLIQIGHNVQIGENTVIAAQTGISGSTKLGKNNMIGGQVGFVGHIEIADDVKIGAQSGIISGIKDESSLWQGSPAFDLRSFQKSNIIFRRLPDLYRKIGELERKIENLKNKE